LTSGSKSMRGTIKCCLGFVAISSKTTATYSVSILYHVLCVRNTKTACSLSRAFQEPTSEVHKATTQKRADAMKASGRSAVVSSTVGCCLSTLDSGTRARMARKFDLCFEYPLPCHLLWSRSINKR